MKRERDGGRKEEEHFFFFNEQLQLEWKLTKISFYFECFIQLDVVVYY